jgi:hypothetical protein
MSALRAAAVDGLIDREEEKRAGGEHGFGWDVLSGADTFVAASEVVEALGVTTFNAATGCERLLAILAQAGRHRLVELIEGIAHLMRTTEAYPNERRGLSVADLEQLGRFYLDVGLVPDMEPHVLRALVKLAFFAPGRETGQVRLAHEIMADCLAARHALAIIRSRPGSADGLGQALGARRDLERSIFVRTLVTGLRQEPELADMVCAHVEADRVRPAQAANARLLLAELQRGA